MPLALPPAQLARDLAIPDLTDSADGPHAIQALVTLAVDALVHVWGCDVRWVRGPRIVSLADNYDRLRYPPEAVTRDARYTRYVGATDVLRSHTTAMVPAALRALAVDPPDDVLLVCPGITYRRDAIDRLHTGTPHQLDLWRIGRGTLGDSDMDVMIRCLGEALAPGRALRSEPRVHPYTLNGRQVDARWHDAWVEVWECGLAHPEVLRSAGLSDRWGLALGMGLDRLLMLRKNVPDIRLLRSADPRVSTQMQDLDPYRPVSSLPAMRRDVSVAIDANDDAEVLGDQVRGALGDDAELLEAVTILSQTPYDALPPAARDRLGMTPMQKNVLVRLEMRPLERTLTDAEANVLRDRVYATIHAGSSALWASR